MNPEIINFVNITICLRFFCNFIPLKRYLLDSHYNNTSHHILGFSDRWFGDDLQHRYNFQGKKGLIHIDSPMTRWHNLCFSFASISKHTTLVLNGIIMFENEIIKGRGIPDEFLEHFTIMRRSLEEYGEHNSMVGKMTDVNIWKTAMTMDKMKMWTRCKNWEKGDVIDWESAEWNTKGLETEEINQKGLCQEEKFENIIFPVANKFALSTRLCKLFGGSMMVAEDAEMTRNIIRLTDERSDLCPPYSWAGYTDKQEEGHFVDVKTGKNLSYFNWRQGEPNGGTKENCVTINNKNGFLYDYYCTSLHCTICNIRTPLKYLNLRGSCPEEKLDSDYTLLLEETTLTGRYGIGGWRRSQLVWNDTLQQWRFEKRKNKEIVAFTNGTTDYPLGIQKWYFLSEKCSDPGEKWRKMSLNLCGKDEFACNSGECIKMEDRCDKNYNCDDFSDEQNCTIITIEGYNKQSPPPILIKNDVNKKTNINVLVKIMDILEINQVSLKFEVKFGMAISWRDTRVKFISLNNDTKKNGIANYETFIWTPKLYFLNTLIPLPVNLEESNIIVSSLKQEKGTVNGNDKVVKSEIFTGSKNKITKKSTFVGTFFCSFENMHFYPFDTETCFINIIMSARDYDFTNLIPIHLDYHGPEDVENFFIKETKMTTKQFSKVQKGIQIKIKFGRRLGSIFLVTYLPTILINTINQATNYFPGTQFSGDIIKVRDEIYQLIIRNVAKK